MSSWILRPNAPLSTPISALGRLLVAYSGADSAFLAFAAHQALGGCSRPRRLALAASTAASLADAVAFAHRATHPAR
jgi:PP-loop superfamily ATP-utilizing enzyme